MATTEKLVIKRPQFIHDPLGANEDFSDMVKQMEFNVTVNMVDVSAGSDMDQSAPGTWKIDGSVTLQHRRDQSEMDSLLNLLRATNGVQKFAAREKPGDAAPDNLEYRFHAFASKISLGGNRGAARESQIPLAINALSIFDGTTERDVATNEVATYLA